MDNGEGRNQASSCSWERRHVSEWTMEKEGTKQVPVVGKDDKREVTILLSIAATGDLLPPQVIHVYQGKTSECHVNVTFPEGWNITHSA